MSRNPIVRTALVGLGCTVLLGCGALTPLTTSPVTNPLEFCLQSDAGSDEDTLPTEYTCDGAGVSPGLAWSGAPSGTEEFALMMTTLPGDGTTKWSWVLYHIPSTTASLPRAAVGIGIAGAGSHGEGLGYEPPCSQGPGPKRYTFTIYALSASPVLPEDPRQVTGDVLTKAIAPVTLAAASLSLTYTRP